MSKLTDIFEFSKRLAASLLKGEATSTIKNTDLLSEENKAYLETKLTDPNYLAKENELLQEINREDGWTSIENKLVKPVKKMRVWKYAAAASVLILVTLPFVLKNENNSLSPEESLESEIKIGTDKATLTLSNGKEISLEKGRSFKNSFAESNGEELVYTESDSIKNNSEVVYNYLTIPRGGQFFIKLDDGTKVWLNSESKLKFPINFIENQPRQVDLVYGEAYFEVSPSAINNGAAFKVMTGSQEIEVLGTEFNVKAYADEEVILTTLVNGKIAWSSDQHRQILTPNDQLSFSPKTQQFTLENVNVYSEISWKDGVLSFKEKSLKDIAVVLSRWYDVDFHFENTQLASVKFNGVLKKSQSLQNILNTIMNTKFINAYEITKNKVTLK